MSLLLSACAQRAPGWNGTPFGHLLTPPEETFLRASTYDRKGGNDDYVVLMPGKSVTILDVDGPAIVQHVWMTFSPRAHPDLGRGVVLQAYWDEEETPSVEAPIGDFFAVGFGESHEVLSHPVVQASGGYNCFWPMPFRSHARWVLTNHSETTMERLYFHIDVVQDVDIPEDALYFHAHWNRGNTKNRDQYTILETKGRGRYVGTVLSMQSMVYRSLGFLEGDERFWIDGDETPRIQGTGTEDYFLGGWYFDRGPFSAWSHGVSVLDESSARVSAFRWHITDSVPFLRNLRLTIEDGFQPSLAGSNVDYSSVAFYYQTEPHEAPSRIRAFSEVRPLPIPPPPGTIANLFEGEALFPRIHVSKGKAQVAKFGRFDKFQFSGDQYIEWMTFGVGSVMTVPFAVEEAGEFRLVLFLGQASDGVSADVLLDDRKIGVVDGYAEGPTFPILPSGPVDLGVVVLAAGSHRLQFQIIGNKAGVAEDAWFFYFDGLLLDKLGK